MTALLEGGPDFDALQPDSTCVGTVQFVTHRGVIHLVTNHEKSFLRNMEIEPRYNKIIKNPGLLVGEKVRLEYLADSKSGLWYIMERIEDVEVR
jgi:hypothetical protein